MKPIIKKDELIIDNVVDAFYQKAKSDFMIGYHFRVIENFDSHIPKIQAFWKTRLLGYSFPQNLARIQFNQAHAALPIKRAEIGRWKTLFYQTMDESMDRSSKLYQNWKNEVETFGKVLESSL